MKIKRSIKPLESLSFNEWRLYITERNKAVKNKNIVYRDMGKLISEL